MFNMNAKLRAYWGTNIQFNSTKMLFWAFICLFLSMKSRLHYLFVNDIINM